MTKIRLLILILFLNCTQSQSQVAYYDALRLKGLFTRLGTSNDTFNSICNILGRYLDTSVTGGQAANTDMVKAAYSGNPFIPDAFKSFGTLSSSPLLSKIAGGIGNLDVTAFADGLAKFLVERTREELNESFFRKFAAFLEGYPEFKVLFPNTSIFVDNYNSWEYSNLLNTLKEAFDKDIKELLANMIRLKDLSLASCQDDACRVRINALSRFLSSAPGRITLSALCVGKGLIAGEKVPDIIDSLTQNSYLGSFPGPHSANIRNGIRLVNIFSYSLRSNEVGRHYVRRIQVAEMFGDSLMFRLYMALVYQQISNQRITFQIGSNIETVANYFKPAQVNGIRQYLDNLSVRFQDIQHMTDSIRQHRLAGSTDPGIDYANFFASVQDGLQALANTSVIDARLIIPSRINEVLNSTTKVLQIAHDIAVRNYNAVVVGVVRLFYDGAHQMPDTADQSEILPFTAAFLKYGSFAANVVAARNADEVKQAIKSFVLPSGSSSLKKHSQFSVSLNAYVGFVYGRLVPKNSVFTTTGLSGSLDTVPLNAANSLSLFAPVGIGFNWGLGWKKKNPGSVSAFISLIDIGSLVSYRFSTDTGEVSNTFKVTLSNIFAPGANVIFGLPNMPLSIGAGMQWVPTMQRDAKSNAFYNLDHSAIRYQVFIAVDLPLLNFHTSKAGLLYTKTDK